MNQPATELRLVVNADDLGESKATNRGILRSHNQGVTTAASLMANGPAFEDAVSDLKNADRLDVGVHVALVAAQALATPLSSGRRSLVGRDGELPSGFAPFAAAYFSGAIEGEEVERETRAQVRRVVEAGLTPSHIDTHQHLHLLPKVGAVVAAVAREHDIPFVRFPREPARVTGSSRARGVRGVLRIGMQAYLPRLQWMLRTHGRIFTTAFRGYHDSGRLDLDAALALVRSMPSTGSVELMCHPVDHEEVPLGGFQQADEVETLLAPQLREAIEQTGARLATFKDLV